MIEPAERGVPAAARPGCLMLVVRRLVRGGAQRLLSSILHHVSAQRVHVLIVKTGRTPLGYEEEVSWFADMAIEQVCLPDCAARDRWPDVLIDLIRRHGVTAVAVSDSDDGYRLLPAIRAAAPSIWIADLQYNPLAQVENNRRFGQFIDITIAQSSLTEAVNNAIIHGNKSDESKLVHIHAEKKNRGIAFCVTDEGYGFNPNKLPDPTCPENIECCGGRGVHIMTTLSDDIRFEDNGRTVEMYFELKKHVSREH